MVHYWIFGPIVHKIESSTPRGHTAPVAYAPRPTDPDCDATPTHPDYTHSFRYSSSEGSGGKSGAAFLPNSTRSPVTLQRRWLLQPYGTAVRCASQLAIAHYNHSREQPSVQNAQCLSMLAPIIISTLSSSVFVLFLVTSESFQNVISNAIPDHHRGRRYRRHGSSHCTSRPKSRDHNPRAISPKH